VTQDREKEKQTNKQTNKQTTTTITGKLSFIQLVLCRFMAINAVTITGDTLVIPTSTYVRNNMMYIICAKKVRYVSSDFKCMLLTYFMYDI